MKLFLRFAACALTILVVSSAAALAWDRADRAAEPHGAPPAPGAVAH